MRRTVASHGQVSNKPKQLRSVEPYAPADRSQQDRSFNSFSTTEGL